jgi:hypothetical protein
MRQRTSMSKQLTSIGKNAEYRQRSDQQNSDVSLVLKRSNFVTSIKSSTTDMTLALAAGWHAFRLIIDRKDTAHTYRYGRCLEGIEVFRRQFLLALAEAPDLAAFWASPRLFLDQLPGAERFSLCPAGSLGAAYSEFVGAMSEASLLNLRDRRLATLPDEAIALDPEAGKAKDPDQRMRWIIARRNLFMTSTHDLCHVLLGAPTDIPGEILVARYQYRHLLVPQNWMNMRLGWLSMAVSPKLADKRQKVRAAARIIDQSTSYAWLDLDEALNQPLSAVRQTLNLPANGLLPPETA